MHFWVLTVIGRESANVTETEWVWEKENGVKVSSTMLNAPSYYMWTYKHTYVGM